MIEELGRAVMEEVRHLHRLQVPSRIDPKWSGPILKHEQVYAMLRIEINSEDMGVFIREAENNGFRIAESLWGRAPGPMMFMNVAVYEVRNLPVAWRVVNPMRSSVRVEAAA